MQGDKIVSFVDEASSAESLVLQMGAAKAGVTVVCFHEKDSQDALDHALRTTNAKGLFFSPSTQIGKTQNTRKTFLQKLMPELEAMYAGDELKLSKYPALRHIVQTGFSKIRGVNMFKDVAVYANPSMSNYSIPANSADALTHVYLRDGREVRSFTSQDFVTASQDLWQSYLSGSTEGEHKDLPVFVSTDLEQPLGFATVLACSSHLKKLFVPGSFSIDRITTSLPRQGSTFLVCDEGLYNFEWPSSYTPGQAFEESGKRVSQVLVGGKTNGVSKLFHHSRAYSVDPYSL